MAETSSSLDRANYVVCNQCLLTATLHADAEKPTDAGHSVLPCQISSEVWRQNCNALVMCTRRNEQAGWQAHQLGQQDTTQWASVCILREGLIQELQRVDSTGGRWVRRPRRRLTVWAHPTEPQGVQYCI